MMVHVTYKWICHKDSLLSLSIFPKKRVSLYYICFMNMQKDRRIRICQIMCFVQTGYTT